MGALTIMNKIAAVFVLVLAIRFGFKVAKFGFKVLAIVVGIIAIQTLLQ